MSYNVSTVDDLEEILGDIYDLQACKKLGRDAYKTFELAQALEDYDTTDWDRAESVEHVTAIRYSLANCAARAQAQYSPNTFKRQMSISGLPQGAQLEKNTEALLFSLSDDTMRAQLISDMYEMSDAIAAKTIQPAAWDKFKRDIEAKDGIEIYDSEIEQAEARARIYEKHNIDPNTPDRELPYYVTKEMEESGVTMNYE